MSDFIIVNAKAIKKYLLTVQKIKKHPNRIKVIYNGIEDPKSIINTGNIKKSSFPIVTIVAGLRPWKDHKTFIHAAAIVLKKAPSTIFKIIGDGPLRQDLQSLIDRLHISKSVFIQGWVENPYDDIRTSICTVISSTHEGLCNSIIESLSLEVPVVATKVGGNPEIIIDGETGFLVKPQSPEEMATAILKLIEKSEIRERMGKVGRLQILEKFAITKRVKEYEDFYFSCLNT